VVWSGRVGSSSSSSSSLSCSEWPCGGSPLALPISGSLAASLRCAASCPWVFCALPLCDFALLAVFFSDFFNVKMW